MRNTAINGSLRDRFKEHKKVFYPETAIDFQGLTTPGHIYDSHKVLSISPRNRLNNYSFAKVKKIMTYNQLYRV